MFFRRKKKKDEQKDSTTIVVTSTTNLPSGGGNNAFCTADQCSFNPRHTAPIQPTSTSVSMTESSGTSLFFEQAEKNQQPGQHFKNETFSVQEEPGNSSLLELIPDELYRMIRTTAIQGCLTSLLLTLSEVVLTDYLKASGYKPGQIYWANQAIRALTIGALGASIGTVIALPIANYLMTEYLGIKPATANYLTTATSVTLAVWNSPLSIVETTATLATAIGTTLVSSKFTRSAYHFVRDSFFSSPPQSAENTAAALGAELR